MDSPSNYDYRRDDQFHSTNPDYSLHAAEGDPHEQSCAPNEERPVHRHPYLEERPGRSSTLVDLSYANHQEYCEFWSALLTRILRALITRLLLAWPRQHAQTLDDGHYSARDNEYSAPGTHDRPFNPLPRRLAA
jgi:hypothetical protein